MSSMRTAKTVSITLPPDLLLKAQECAAKEHRTMSELFREALRKYVGSEQRSRLSPERKAEWDALLERTHAHGAAMGITSEEDVDRLIHEYRKEKRESQR
jgi:metal-responsive CopG/Arc/MetJ family transcriptional regulator